MICHEFPGWTREYVRDFNPMEMAAVMGYIEGHRKLMSWIEQKKAQAQKRAARKPKRR